ncbi:MAG TPA: cysteine--tRNA ligase [Oscillospiraceae bacterium]|nr:cysteine--tRNA ligase [Oscillospiraceae bacterium]
MKIYNTLTRQKEEFIPMTAGEAKIYACGPTVYNYIHIGNARPICVFDVLRRYLEYRGMSVTYVQNFTDIDDKIINKANEENTDYLTISQRYMEEYKTDAKGLNVRPATIHPLATENIDEIIGIISTLIEKGYAYVAENGDVYFHTKKFKEYGKLSHQPLEDLQAGARISVGEIKEDAMDFAVWKSAKPGEPSWIAPWGSGRPGWHIECSAMARRYLGKTIDIHCGGQDLIFPHHENEIAQSECCNDAPFAHYWMHNGYINVDNRKMSKSLGNFFTVRDVAEQFGYEPIRYLMVAAHYHMPINYSLEMIEQSKAALERLYNCRDNLTFIMNNAPEGEKDGEHEIKKRLTQYEDHFVEAMEDDLNTADAISALFDFARDLNTNFTAATAPSKELCSYALNLFNELAGVLGLLYAKNDQTLDDEIEELIRRRTQARKDKDWATADSIRDELKARHVVLEDTPQGIKWKIEE